MSTYRIGERDTRTGWRLVYVGGRHTVWCDGIWHHQVNEGGELWRDKIRCDEWDGGCPAKMLDEADRRVG